MPVFSFLDNFWDPQSCNCQRYEFQIAFHHTVTILSTVSLMHVFLRSIWLITPRNHMGIHPFLIADSVLPTPASIQPQRWSTSGPGSSSASPSPSSCWSSAGSGCTGCSWAASESQGPAGKAPRLPCPSKVMVRAPESTAQGGAASNHGECMRRMHRTRRGVRRPLF